jgi:putative spermidine/putrescine transport system substrate-binding protein/spermidine/putrescine transport system substrate-binding protein
VKFARTFGLAAVLAAAVVAQAQIEARAQDAKEVRLLVYEGYADQAWVDEFQAQTGITVKVTYVGGVDEQIAKMKASNGADFDIVAVDTASLGAYAAQGLIAPIDFAEVTARDNLLPEFRDAANATFDGKTWGVPMAWGSLGLVYDKATFPEAPKSWSVLWDPQYQGRVTSLDDANNNVNFAAIALGIEDPFHLTEEQFAQVKQKLADLKGNLLTYYAGFDEGNTIWAENEVVLMFSMGELAEVSLKEKGFDVGYAIPEEGAVGWLDNLTVSAGSPHPETAYAWINFFLQPKIGMDMNEKFGYAPTTAPVEGMDYASRLKWAVNPEDYNRRQQLWNDVKAGVQ